MRGAAALNRPIVLGAGPAGSVAATLLARAGAEPLLLDRDAQVGDGICGGFLSWRTVAALRELGCDPAELGARPVARLRLFAGDRQARVALPHPASALSRRSLDGALRDLAVSAGARLEIDRARGLSPGLVEGEARDWRSEAIFLATGKHDVRGSTRPRDASDPALGLRVRIPGGASLTALLEGAIELHLFPGGYAGIVLQEDGSANVCLAIRKSLLAGAEGGTRDLLDRLAAAHPAFAERMKHAAPDLPVDTIGAVPYGWTAEKTEPGLYRLGDQAAVIPSLAGEGIAIAIASARAASEAWLKGHSAESYQTSFAGAARRPVRVSEMVWHLVEIKGGANALTALADRLPPLARFAMRLSRI